VDDGTALTEPVAVKSNCQGRIRTEGYTDSKGHFSFEMTLEWQGTLVQHRLLVMVSIVTLLLYMLLMLNHLVLIRMLPLHF
jgi:hypothetical protein